MIWQFNTQKPIYAQLIEHIRMGILSGEYPPGSILPSVRALALEAEVNPNTMQRALAELESRGLLRTQRTAGRYVTEDNDMIQSIKKDQAGRFIDDFMLAMKGLGYDRQDILGLLAAAGPEDGGEVCKDE